MAIATASEVRVANREAMQRLDQGDLTSARFELDRAHEALALLDSFPSSEMIHNEASMPSGAHRTNAAATVCQKGSLGYLRSLTHNNDASWWRAHGDLGRAVECLSKALAESDKHGGVSTRQLASTHSNLCAVLSQVVCSSMLFHPFPSTFITYFASILDTLHNLAFSKLFRKKCRWDGMASR
jgi:hypothetical protein